MTKRLRMISIRHGVPRSVSLQGTALKRLVEAVTAYIIDQAQHRRKFSYQEELRKLLKRHQVAFDEHYLWE